jgi:hypothetical protein
MRAAVPPTSVALYRTASQGPGKYEEVALLHSSGPATTTNEPQMYESMKQKAAELWANALILDAISEPSAGAKIAGAFLGYAPERQEGCRDLHLSGTTCSDSYYGAINSPTTSCRATINESNHTLPLEGEDGLTLCTRL